MAAKTFQEEVIDRLARIEEKQDSTMTTVACHTEKIDEHSLQIARVEERAKSAHHRIDGIYCAAGAIGGIAGWLADKLATLWGGKGGG